MATEMRRAEDGSVGSRGFEALACVSCRSRKLKCDRIVPACGRCIKFDHDCVYPGSRRKPTFKRRNVMELEARLAQVEEHLKDVTKRSTVVDGRPRIDEPPTGLPNDGYGSLAEPFGQGQQRAYGQSQEGCVLPLSETQPKNVPHDAQLMELGLSEPLPPFEMMEELYVHGRHLRELKIPDLDRNNIYFKTHHFICPIVHPARYLQEFYSFPLRKPPLCLQYAIWATSAKFHPVHHLYAELFYERARNYLRTDEMKGFGDYFVDIRHAQAWVLIATYEARSTLFPRAAMSCASAARLVHMLGLHRLDDPSGETLSPLQPASTWAEEEERRRTFWGAFAADAHSSITTGWPSLIDINDAMIRLPTSEEAFHAGKREESAFLGDVFNGASYSGLATVVIICHVFKAIMRHVHFPKPTDRSEDLHEGPFWKRHRDLDNSVSSLVMFLPEPLRLPSNQRDMRAVHMNLNLQSCVICIHHAAIDAIESHGHPESTRQHSMSRLKHAADEIAKIVRQTPHASATFKSPLSALSLYCATSVYVFLAKDDSTKGLSSDDVDSLESIFHTMKMVGRHSEIARAFLRQACMDIERSDLAATISLPNYNVQCNILGSSRIPLLARSGVSKAANSTGCAQGRAHSLTRSSKCVPDPGSKTNSRGTSEIGGPFKDAQRLRPIVELVTRSLTTGEHAQPQNHNRNRGPKSPATHPRPKGRVSDAQTGVGTRINDEIHTALTSDGFQSSTLSDGQWMDTSSTLLSRVGPSVSSSPANDATSEPIVATTQPLDSHDSHGGGLEDVAMENRRNTQPFQDEDSTPSWPDMGDSSFPEGADEILGDSFADMNTNWVMFGADVDMESSAMPPEG